MLKFYAKVAVQHLMSMVPASREFYLWVLNNVAKTALPTHERVQQKVDIGLEYLRALEELGEGDILKRGTHLDIGAGWHLTIPLLYYQLGCERQILVDIQEAARSEIVFAVRNLLQDSNLKGRKVVRSLPETKGHDLNSYLKSLGIEYDPHVMGPLPVADASVHLVTSTQTLLYPPRQVVRHLFEEAARVLVPGGYFLSTIHLYDLYSLADPSISRFNFLRYREAAWNRWFNCSVVSYNRLRASDFANLFEGLPFEIGKWDVTPPTDADYRELDRVPLSAEFSAYDRNDLAATHLLFAMRRR